MMFISLTRRMHHISALIAIPFSVLLLSASLLPVSGQEGEKKAVPQTMPDRPKFLVFDKDTIWVQPDKPALFKGGNEALKNYKTEKLKYPADAEKAGFEGTVFVSFIVEKSGELTDFSITTGISPALDAEALRVAKEMPLWVPGVKDGKAVITRSGTAFEFISARSRENRGDVPTEVFMVVEEMPRFPGGEKALLEYIMNNVIYPEDAKINNIQGRVILRFCVNYQGNVEQVGVIRGVSLSVDQEAIRVIKSLPRWEPGRQGGKPVNVWYNVPVTFALEGPNKDNNMAPPPPPPPPPAPTAPPARLRSGYDEPPLFPGGEAAIMKFIAENLKYPQAAIDKRLEGIVKIRIAIDQNGNVTSPSIFSSVAPELDHTAYNVVSRLPSWKPGKLDGKPVMVYYNIPVEFRLK